ncbi:MAG: 2-oxo acid dehydrogenase subunit E2 [Candidatus Schekmanbacteria bacterium]|nr:2-oxo acid dehydrogenase subunit E2 [Candidatus Schekmanbacteria bacterium]
MPFRLPELGENIHGGDVVNVLVAVGDSVAAGQPVIELETDKAVIEVPAPQAGRIASLAVGKGEHVEVGAVVLTLEPVGEASVAGAPVPPVPASPRAPAPDVPAPPPPPARATAPFDSALPAGVPREDLAGAAPASTDERAVGVPQPVHTPHLPLPAGPATRAHARKLGVNLTMVPATGPAGRITLDDVQAYVRVLAARAAADAGAPAPEQERATATTAAEPAAARASTAGTAPAEDTDREALSSLRLKIGRQMHLSWTTIPHVTHFDEADITALEELRVRLDRRLGETGARLTTTVLLVKAAVACLRDFPRINATLSADGQSLSIARCFHIGIAVDTADGLIVPVLRDADRPSLARTATMLAELAARTRARTVGLDELRGATFTISNLGGIGGTGFTPIINPPQVAILGVARAAVGPRWVGEAFAARLILPFCLSYDHRVIDGAEAARFCHGLRALLEDPDGFLLEA